MNTPIRMRRRPLGPARFLAMVALVTAAISPAHAQPDDFEWRLIGAPGNRPTLPTEAPFGMRPLGAVSYDYHIMTCKLDNEQYLEFVRAYAPYWQAQADDFQLTGYWIWATQGSDGSYSYDVQSGAERFAARITWEQAARYCNWLHNGKVNEAWAFETGAYDTSTFYQDEKGFHHGTRHQPGARYWIPTLDEWVKAAYYDPDRHGEGQEGYWLYPNGSDEPLFMALPQNGGETVGDLLWQQGPRDLGAWDLMQYPDTRSPWGLLDVSATVPDYTEDLSNTQTVIMGGSLAGDPSYGFADYLRAPFDSGALSGSTFGALRIARSVPSPGSVSGVFLAMLALTRRGRHER